MGIKTTRKKAIRFCIALMALYLLVEFIYGIGIGLYVVNIGAEKDAMKYAVAGKAGASAIELIIAILMMKKKRLLNTEKAEAGPSAFIVLLATVALIAFSNILSSVSILTGLSTEDPWNDAMDANILIHI